MISRFSSHGKNIEFEDDDAILVNLTGNGAERAQADGIAIPATPDHVFTKAQDNLDNIRRMLAV